MKRKPAVEPPFMSVGHRRILTAVLLFFIVGAIVSVTATDYGLTWDESIYFGRGLKYMQWFDLTGSPSVDAYAPQGIAEYWWTGQDHPPLGPLWIGACIRFFAFTLQFLDVIAAARMSAVAVFGIAAACVYLAGAAWRGERAGLLSAGIFICLPRVFAHGQLATLEMLTVLTWLLVTISFVKGIQSRLWSVLCGLFFGAALLTKINALFLPLFLLPWGFLFHGRKALRNTICMGVLGPALFIAGWPIMWHDTLRMTWAYIAGKGNRVIIPVYYFGTAWRDRLAPWHYPFIMLLATTPIVILAPAAAAIGKFVRALRAKWRDACIEALLLWGFLFPVLLIAMPGVPKYDGIRLFLPAMPFLAILAAEGAGMAWDRWFSGANRKFQAWLAGALFAVWLLTPIIIFHPYQLCYYSELVGGPWGAHRLGFETTYWNDTFDRAALDYLNEHVEAGGAVALVAGGDFVWAWYQSLGYVRADIRAEEFAANNWDYLVVIPRQGYWNDDERKFVAEHQPVWVNNLPPVGNLPVCLIYRRSPKSTPSIPRALQRVLARTDVCRCLWMLAECSWMFAGCLSLFVAVRGMSAGVCRARGWKNLTPVGTRRCVF